LVDWLLDGPFKPLCEIARTVTIGTPPSTKR
jgi:hypothetical protein